jgi:hypothetical protein
MKYDFRIPARMMALFAVSSLISSCANNHVREYPDAMSCGTPLVSGINLAQYAVIGNHLEWAGVSGRSAVLKSHGLTEAGWKNLSETFDLRLIGNRVLVDCYEANAFRVAKGHFAVYGRDLADSYANGEDLKLDPPLPIRETGMLNGQIAAIWEVPDSSESERLALKANLLDRHGLSSYDYSIVSGWWFRKAQVAEMHGDHSIMRALVNAERAAMAIHSEQVPNKSARKPADEN